MHPIGGLIEGRPLITGGPAIDFSHLPIFKSNKKEFHVTANFIK